MSSILVSGRAHAGLRAVLETHKHRHLSAERAAVEFDRLLAAAIEEEIRLHCLNGITFCGGHGFLVGKRLLLPLHDEPGVAFRTTILRISVYEALQSTVRISIER
jgi:hypothetical protein